MKNKGQSLVELAVSFAVLVLLLSGAVEFSIAFFQFVTLRDAAQEGALYAATHPDELSEIEARSRCSSGEIINGVFVCGGRVPDLTSPEVVVDITYSGEACEGLDENNIPNDVKVAVTYEHKTFMPFFSFFKDRIELRADVTDTILSPVCQ